MANKLMKNNVTILEKITTSMVLRNFLDFGQSYSGNVSGIKIAVSLKDSQGVWHTMTQRIFKNGSIHIKKH